MESSGSDQASVVRLCQQGDGWSQVASLTHQGPQLGWLEQKGCLGFSLSTSSLAESSVLISKKLQPGLLTRQQDSESDNRILRTQTTSLQLIKSSHGISPNSRVAGVAGGGNRLHLFMGGG